MDPHQAQPLTFFSLNNNDRWSSDHILEELSLIYILTWVYVLRRWQQSKGTLNAIIYFSQSLGSCYYLCTLSYYRVNDLHLSVLFTSQPYAAAAEVWDDWCSRWCFGLTVISGLLYIIEHDCLREFFGGLWGIDKGLAVMLWSSLRGVGQML